MGIVANLNEALNPGVVSAIGRSVGLPDALATEAVSVGAPALLAAIAGAASSEAGSAALSAVLSGALSRPVPESNEDRLAALAEQGPAIAEAGKGVIASILGGGRFAVLAEKLKDHLVLPEGTAGSLLGVLGQVVTQVIGRSTQAAGVSPAGAAAWLTDQRQEIASALPGSFAATLRAAGLEVAPPAAPVGMTTTALPSAAAPAAAIVSPTAASGKTPRGAIPWRWVGVAAGVLIAWALWSLATRDDRADQNRPAGVAEGGPSQTTPR